MKHKEFTNYSFCAANEGFPAPRAGSFWPDAHDWYQPVRLAQRLGAGDEA